MVGKGVSRLDFDAPKFGVLGLGFLGLVLACAGPVQPLRAEEGGCTKVTADQLGVPGLTLLSASAGHDPGKFTET